MTQQRSNDVDLIDEFRKRDESATRVIAGWKVCAEDAAARAKALQGEIDRCVAHIREGQQLRPDEPDAGLEALVVGWVKYHGDCCNFKARAERAEAQRDEAFTLLADAIPDPKGAMDSPQWHRRMDALAAGLSLQEEQE